MLRNRCPDVVNLALKWCKSKDKWVNHAYKHFVGIYKDKNERDGAARIILGISNKYRKFEFHKTINWDEIDDEEKKHWKIVEDWVNWFQAYHLDMEQCYKTYGIEQLKQDYLPSLDEDKREELAKILVESFRK